MVEHQSDHHSATLHPAHLWIGSPEELVSRTINFLQKQLCKYGGCGVCTACLQIIQQQHHAVVWLHPEKNYTVDDLEIIFNTIAFQLEPQEKVFFILQKADCLTPLCANSLLKSLEEPPTGYHFVLLTHRLEPILPTIQSRCLIQTYASAHTGNLLHPLFIAFSQPRKPDPLVFLQEIEKIIPSERETLDLIDQLLAHWITCYKKAIVSNDTTATKRALTMIATLKRGLAKPPMPGSSKLFWRNIFLQVM